MQHRGLLSFRYRMEKKTALSNAAVVNDKEPSAERENIDKSHSEEGRGSSEQLASTRRQIRTKVLKARKTLPNPGTTPRDPASSGDCAALPVTTSVRSAQVVRCQGQSSDGIAILNASNYGPSKAGTGSKGVQKRPLHTKESEESNKKAKIRGPTGIEPSRKENSTGNGRTPATASYSRSEQKEIFDAVHSLQILGRTPTPER